MGILIIVVGGLNSLPVVIGPFLIIGSICSMLRQTDELSIEQEVPILTIIFGMLLLFVQILKLPTPEIFKDDEKITQPENGCAES